MEPSVYSAAYIKLTDKWTRPDLPDFPQLVMEKPYLGFPSSAEAIGSLYLPATEPSRAVRSFRGVVAPPGKESRYPAICANAYGKGMVYYLCVDIFKAYWKTNHIWLRQLMEPVFKNIIKKPLYELKGFSNLELNMTEGNGARYLHMVNFLSGKSAHGGYPMLDMIPAVRDVPVRIRSDKPGTITTLSNGKELTHRFQNGYMEATVPEVGVYEVLKIF
jgi:hypothetical protein